MNRSLFLVFIIAFLFCTCLADPSDVRFLSGDATPAAQPDGGQSVQQTPTVDLSSVSRTDPYGLTPSDFQTIFGVSNASLHKTHLQTIIKMFYIVKENHTDFQTHFSRVSDQLFLLPGSALSAQYLPIRHMADNVGSLTVYINDILVWLRVRGLEGTFVWTFFEDLKQKLGATQQQIRDARRAIRDKGPLILGNSYLLAYEGFYDEYGIDSRHTFRLFVENRLSISTMLAPRTPYDRAPDRRELRRALNVMDRENLPAAGYPGFPSYRTGYNLYVQRKYAEDLDTSTSMGAEYGIEPWALHWIKFELQAIIDTRIEYERLYFVTRVDDWLVHENFTKWYNNEPSLDVYLLGLENLASMLNDLKEENPERAAEFDKVMTKINSLKAAGATALSSTIAPIMPIQPDLLSKATYIKAQQDFFAATYSSLPFVYLAGLLDELLTPEPAATTDLHAGERNSAEAHAGESQERESWRDEIL